MEDGIIFHIASFCFYHTVSCFVQLDYIATFPGDSSTSSKLTEKILSSPKEKKPTEVSQASSKEQQQQVAMEMMNAQMMSALGAGYMPGLDPSYLSYMAYGGLPGYLPGIPGVPMVPPGLLPGEYRAVQSGVTSKRKCRIRFYNSQLFQLIT